MRYGIVILGQIPPAKPEAWSISPTKGLELLRDLLLLRAPWARSATLPLRTAMATRMEY